MERKKQKLVRLTDVRAKLVLPGATAPISDSALRITHLPALGITPVNSEGQPKAYRKQEAFVTEEEAARIEAHFKQKHWRKFKGAAG